MPSQAMAVVGAELATVTGEPQTRENAEECGKKEGSAQAAAADEEGEAALPTAPLPSSTTAAAPSRADARNAGPCLDVIST